MWKKKGDKNPWMRTLHEREKHEREKEREKLKPSLSVATNMSALKVAPSTDSTKSLSTAASGLITPKQPITFANDWSDIFVSPGAGATKLKPFDEARKAMKEDKIEEQPFLKERSHKERGFKAQRCVYFLYGRDYKGKEDSQVRVRAIQRMVADDKNYDRLKDVALSDPIEQVACPDKQANCVLAFLNMVLVLRDFFKKTFEEAGVSRFGGYPGTPMARFQKGNNCYMPAVCVWYSLMMRKRVYMAEGVQNPNPYYMVNIAQQARRHVLKDDEHLEKRVLGDVGHPTAAFAKAVVDDQIFLIRDWAEWGFEEESPAEDVHRDCERYGVGLVYNFTMHDGMRKTRKKAIERLNKGGDQAFGYYKFDGCTEDTEGEFVAFEMSEEATQLREEQKARVKKQKDDARKDQQDQRLKIGTVLFRSEPVTTGAVVNENAGAVVNENAGASSASSVGTGASLASSAGASASSASSTEPDTEFGPGSGLHAMVLLGGETHTEVKDGKSNTKHYFMLLNWWKSMPVLLVSADYMKTCKAVVRFRKTTPHTNLAMTSSSFLVSECESQVHGEEAGEDAINDILDHDDFQLSCAGLPAFAEDE